MDKYLQRLFSSLVLIAFIATNSSFSAYGASSASPSSSAAPPALLAGVKSVTIPGEIGKIQESFQGKGDSVVVLIQDAHAIPDAQRNIQKLIEHFQKQYGLNLIGVEGSAAELDPQIFRSFPDKKILKKIFEDYFEKGELTGATAAAIFSPANGPAAVFRGVEDWPLYEEGLGFYLKAMKSRPGFEKQLSETKKRQQAEKQKIYSGQLFEIDQALEAFHENRQDLLSVLKKLDAIKNPALGSELGLLLEEEKRNTGNQVSVETEVKKIAGEAARSLGRQKNDGKLQKFNQKRQEFQTSRISAAEFAVTLKEIVPALKIPAVLSRPLQNQKRMREIEGTKFFKDFEAYAQSVKDSLFRNDEERKLDRQSRERAVLAKLSKLELNHEEWEEIKTKDQRLKTEGENQKEGEPGLWFPYFAFYRNAEKRDEAFLKNLTGMGERTLLVAGGFHSQGLMRRLKEKQISYLLVMPRIGSIPENTHYRESMQGDVSWKDYFRAENGQVNLYEAFVRAARDKLLGKPVSDPRLLKQWRDQILLDLAKKGEIRKAGEYTPFLDEIVQGLQSAAKTGRPDWQTKVEKFIKNLRQLNTQGQLTGPNIAKLLEPSTMQAYALANMIARRQNINARYAAARSEARATPPNILETSTDAGTAGTHSSAYYHEHTRPKIREQILSRKFVLLQYRTNGFHATVGRNTSPLESDLMERILKMNTNSKIKDLLAQNPDIFKNLKIYLFEPEEGTRDATHRHLLTAMGRNFELAFSGTNKRGEPVVYLMREALIDLDTRLLNDILTNQILLAGARSQAWHDAPKQPLSFGKFTPKAAQLLGRIQKNSIIQAEIAQVHKDDLKISGKYAIEDHMATSVLSHLSAIVEQLPAFGPAKTILNYANSFSEAVNQHDFDAAIKWWGLITYEMKDLEIRASENPTPLNKQFVELLAVKLFKGISAPISEVFEKYTLDHGVFNQEGEEHGKAVGLVIVVDDPLKVGEAFAKFGNGRKEPVIWVLPYLPDRYDQIPGEGIIISSAVNRHATDTAKEQSIPLAVIPNAAELLKEYNGKTGMLRVSDTGDVRFRLAHPEEQGIPRPKLKQMIKVPQARTDGPPIYRLSEVDEHFVSFVGPKAAGLGKMMADRIKVPDGIILSFHFWDRFAKANQLEEKIAPLWKKITVQNGTIQNSDQELQGILDEIKALILKGEFPKDLLEELKQSIDQLRSENGIEKIDFDALLRYIRLVFASKYKQQPVRLRIRNNTPDHEVMPAVIIQVPEKAQFAGTLYTADTISQDRNQISVMASHGQGAAVVGENGYPAAASINKITGETEPRHRESRIDQRYEIASKSFFYVRSSYNFEDLIEFRTAGFYESYPDKSEKETGVAPIRMMDVLPAERDMEILTDQLMMRLKKQGEDIEALYDYRPQDIEWAMNEKGEIWILQSRPMKLDKLPAEKLMDDLILDGLGAIDFKSLQSMKAAANTGNLSELLSWFDFKKTFQELTADAGKYASRVVAARYLALIGNRADVIQQLSLDQVKEAITFIETGTNYMDAYGVSSLLTFLRRASLITKDPEIEEMLRKFFVESEVLNKKGMTHLVAFEIAKARVVHQEFKSAVQKLAERNVEAAFPDIADRTIRILSTIPIEFSGPLLQAYAASDKVPGWMNEYAERIIDRLTRYGKRSALPEPKETAGGESTERQVRSEVRKVAEKVVGIFKGNARSDFSPGNLRIVTPSRLDRFISEVEGAAEKSNQEDLILAQEGLRAITQEINKPVVFQDELSDTDMREMSPEALKKWIGTMLGAVTANKFIGMRLQIPLQLANLIRDEKKAGKYPVRLDSIPDSKDFILLNEGLAKEKRWKYFEMEPVLAIRAKFKSDEQMPQLDFKYGNWSGGMTVENKSEALTAAFLWVSLSKRTAEMIARDPSKSNLYHVPTPAALGPLAQIGEWLLTKGATATSA